MGAGTGRDRGGDEGWWVGWALMPFSMWKKGKKKSFPRKYEENKGEKQINTCAHASLCPCTEWKSAPVPTHRRKISKCAHAQTCAYTQVPAHASIKKSRGIAFWGAFWPIFEGFGAYMKGEATTHHNIHYHTS